jgi:hypothetical protein
LGDFLKKIAPKSFCDIFKKKCAQRQKISPKWRNFAQSGHTSQKFNSSPNSQQGLPDFSLNKIQKREKYTKLPQTIPNVHKI